MIIYFKIGSQVTQATCYVAEDDLKFSKLRIWVSWFNKAKEGGGHVKSFSRDPLPFPRFYPSALLHSFSCKPVSLTAEYWTLCSSGEGSWSNPITVVLEGEFLIGCWSIYTCMGLSLIPILPSTHVGTLEKHILPLGGLLQIGIMHENFSLSCHFCQLLVY